MSHIKPLKNPYKVAIFGSCTTRDIFNRNFNPSYKDYFEVVCFQNQTSILSLMSSAIEYTEASLTPLQGWDKESVKSEFEKSFLDNLIESKPDILIIDFFADARFKSIEIENAYITVNEWKTTKSNFYREASVKNSPFMPTEDQLKKKMKAFYDFLQKYLPKTKIILNQARGVKSYTNAKGTEEFFNQKFINSLNERWNMLDQLFIKIASPIQIDVMNPTVKGYINHQWSIGYVHFTPNFYHNFLKILIAIQSINQIEFLESSLAKLVPTNIFPEDKLTLIEDIRSNYISLSKENKYHIDTWLNSRYKEFLKLLVAYNQSIYNYVKFLSYSFRGSLKNTVVKDFGFMAYLIEPIINGKLFPEEKKSAYAHLNYGNIMYHNYKNSQYIYEQVKYFQESKRALTFTFENAKTDYLQSSSAYFLAELYSYNSDFKNALYWYKKAANADKPKKNIHALLLAMLLHTVKINAFEIFENITKVFTKENTQNKEFWTFLQTQLENSTLSMHIETILNECHFIKSNKKWKTKEVEETFTLLKQYIHVTVDFSDYETSNNLQELYRNPLLKEKGKAEILYYMANTYEYKHHDLSRSILMASESNTMSYSKEKSHFISSLVLTNFSEEIRNILKTYPYVFKSESVNFYVQENTRNIAAWKRFLKRGFISGYFHEEVDFLEYLLVYTQDVTFQKILKTRLAYLYYTGTSGLSEDNHETPNIPKSKEYFKAIKNNPLVKKYLNHPRLAIYQDMEQYLDNTQENYLYFENKDSDELLIVFSCAGSYNRYTQLKVFYEKNKTNVLFLNNPNYNWYHGSEWKRIQKTIEAVALKKFKKENIITYFGSMGGYAALSTGLHYGFRTIVFNPQVDLNIWIKHRPAISVRLLKEKKLYHIQNIKNTAFEQTPIYYATSSAMEDVEAFKLFITKLSTCKEGFFIIEKIPDNIHEGIFGLIYRSKQQDAVLNIAKIQKEYTSTNIKLIDVITLTDSQSFWDYILYTDKLRVILKISKGNIYFSGVEDNFLSPPKLVSLKQELTTFKKRFTL